MSVPHRIALLSTALPGTPLASALKYLILSQNTRQTTFEFFFLPEPPDSVFIRYLKRNQPISRAKVKADAATFLDEYWQQIDETNSGYGLSSEGRVPLIFVTNASFDCNYYATGKDDWGIIALGHWAHAMAPPSMLEFFQILIVERAIKLASGERWPGSHLATKGCLLDFTAHLHDARYQIMVGFLCSRCRTELAAVHSEAFVDDVLVLMSKDWVGSNNEDGSVAMNARKLGYDMFLTKGVQPTALERLSVVLQEEGVKTILKIIAGVAIVGILLWLGIKGS